VGQNTKPYLSRSGKILEVVREGEIMNAIPKSFNVPKDMAQIIAVRVNGLKEAHANNLIEGLDVGADVFAEMLERAMQPISDEEYTNREKEITRRMFTTETLAEMIGCV
jgi:hypothetical protein